MKRILFCLITMIVLGVGATANAALINRGTDALGNRLIYDDDLDITWYDFTNSATTWQDQVDWALDLSVNFGDTTYDDWRLPSTVDGFWTWGTDGTTTAGYNITTSELGHLFYSELGNQGQFDTSGVLVPAAESGLIKIGAFQNLKNDAYWSGTEWAPDLDSAIFNFSWYFKFDLGEQQIQSQSVNLFAMAVRDGDVLQKQTKDIAIDIKPKRCPNKLKINKKKGYIKVAILGTQNFDVSMIDIATLNINGIFSVKSKLKDVTAPAAKIDNYPCYCEIMPKDTYEDLLLKFNSQDIIASLGAVQDGDIRELTLTGMLLDGTAIGGKDCILIEIREKKDCSSSDDDSGSRHKKKKKKKKKKK